LAAIGFDSVNITAKNLFLFNMGVDKRTLHLGNGVDYPKRGDFVTMEYTGWLFDPTKPENKGGEKP
jgi:hypothetical protein